MASIKQLWKAFSKRYVQFVEKQGFFILLAACIGVIASTAVWTNHTGKPSPAPTPPANQAAPAAQLMQESLKDASTPSPSVTPSPQIWYAPLPIMAVVRGFDATRLAQSGVTGVWRLHDAVDLQCESGAIVRAIADGTVLHTAEKGVNGAEVTIDHGDGIVAYYQGLAMLAALRAGDPIEAGQTVGFGGNAVLDETDLGPHLHLRVTRGGQAIDPMLLLRGAKSPEP